VDPKMILPPFFGFLSKYSEQDINRAIVEYLTLDVATYIIPTNRLNLTYITSDLLTYNTNVVSNVLLSYITVDSLFYNRNLSKAAAISYVTSDILCYELPPTIPNGIENINVREKDSLGIFNWIPPYNGKSSIIDYTIEYEQSGTNNWIYYNDGLSTNTGITIPFTNDITYRIRICAINSVGSGNFKESSYFTPSGGIDLPCDILAYLNLDQSDRNQINTYSCYIFDTFVTDNVIFGTPNSGIFNTNYWYFPGSIFTITDNLSPNYGESTYPHMHISGAVDYKNPWSLSGNFTISFFMRPKVAESGSYTLLGTSSQIINNNNWSISRQDDILSFKINDNTVVQGSGIVFSTTGFTHVAITRSNYWVSLFVNGLEKEENYNTTNINIESPFLILGAKPSNNGYNFSNYDGWGITTDGFSGDLDEILVSRSCLYRGNFSTPTSPRSSIIDCSCNILEAPLELQVYYIE
jgi:hypothetical protein